MPPPLWPSVLPQNHNAPPLLSIARQALLKLLFHGSTHGTVVPELLVVQSTLASPLSMSSSMATAVNSCAPSKTQSLFQSKVYGEVLSTAKRSVPLIQNSIAAIPSSSLAVTVIVSTPERLLASGGSIVSTLGGSLVSLT